MKARLIFTLLFVLAAAGLAHGADAARGYEAFRLVRTRNIFDPNRQPMRTEGPRSDARQPQSNHLALTGTMVTPEKALAFFSGSAADSNKVAGIGETVGTYKVKAISPQTVELEKGGEPITLPVGRQITLEGTVTARVQTEAGGAAPASPASSASTAPAPAPSSENGAPAPSGPAASPGDVLRRMMERRAKELSK